MVVPLRPDPTAMRDLERRSFIRATAAMAATTTRGRSRQERAPDEYLRANWRDDDLAPRIMKAASNPLTTSGFAQVQAFHLLDMLGADCAGSKLLSLGARLDLENISSIKLPFVAGSGRPALPLFIGEGQPIPAVDLATSGMILGPVNKVAIIAAVTGELQSGSAETATQIIGQALSISAAQSLDTKLFSADAATPNSPAGLLHGIPQT